MIRILTFWAILLFTATQSFSQDPNARVKGMRYYAEWNPDSTLHYLVPLYRANPQDDSLGLAVAEASLWKKDYKTATGTISNLVQPEAPDALRVKGLLFEQAGRLAEALELYNKAIPKLTKPWGTMERKAQVLAWLGKTEEAKSLIAEVIASKKVSEGLRLRASLHLALWTAWGKDLDQALAMTQAVLQKNPKHVDALMLLAQLQEWKGEYRKAKEAYGKVLVLEPNHADARLKLGKLQWVE